MGILDKIKGKVTEYVEDKKEEKAFMKQIKKEAIIESKDDIKAAMKQKITADFVKKSTTSKSEKLKGMFNLNALGDIDAKITRMSGGGKKMSVMDKMNNNQSGSPNVMDKMSGNSKPSDKLAKMMGNTNKTTSPNIMDKMSGKTNSSDRLTKMMGNKKSNSNFMDKFNK